MKKMSRFDARLPEEQKLLLEKASILGGYRNLTDFVLKSANEKAKEIIQAQQLYIANEKDGLVFFEAITNPKKPNSALKKAFKDYLDFNLNKKK